MYYSVLLGFIVSIIFSLMATWTKGKLSLLYFLISMLCASVSVYGALKEMRQSFELTNHPSENK